MGGIKRTGTGLLLKKEGDRNIGNRSKEDRRTQQERWGRKATLGLLQDSVLPQLPVNKPLASSSKDRPTPRLERHLRARTPILPQNFGSPIVQEDIQQGWLALFSLSFS